MDTMDIFERADSSLDWLSNVAELAGRQEAYSAEAYGVIVGLYAVAAQLAAVQDRLGSLLEILDK